jgi:alpha-glucosidase
LRIHHDGSGLYVPEQAPAPGDPVSVFVRVPASAPVRRVYVRTTLDGEPGFALAVEDRRAGGEVWWRTEVTVRNPVTKLPLPARRAGRHPVASGG